MSCGQISRLLIRLQEKINNLDRQGKVRLAFEADEGLEVRLKSLMLHIFMLQMRQIGDSIMNIQKEKGGKRILLLFDEHVCLQQVLLTEYQFKELQKYRDKNIHVSIVEKFNDKVHTVFF